MSVKVAVRVRPFNERQKFLGCICCVEMKESTTVLHENKQKNKKQHYFTFDYSFWSHDQYQLRPDGYMYPVTPKYIDQERLYNIIGKELLDNSWQGYNCCLFAYGQTGAGKSYSMLGYGANRGIVPLVCEELFYKMKKNQKKGAKQYEISLSMLEIYNQKVQDLFVPTSKRPQNGLKIRQNKTLGVYVEGLTKFEVLSYADIERRMQEGNKHRSLASTLMNQYSSRAHTIILIEFIQKQWINKAKMNKKSSFINLVDLAGSERVSKTGIVDNKDRLKQASNINKSLHTLGRVIEILAEQISGKAKSAQVPYRDSALTRILQSALGGNSKTIMICAISPANDNYEETLSTLRYADQTKKIKNKPIINESAVDKIIRQLREQNERLKKMLENSEENSLATSRIYTQSEKREMRSNLRASMREVQKEIKKNLKSFAINTEEAQEDEQSLMMTEFIDLEEPSQFFSELSFDWGNKAQVYITNLNEDELLNYKVRYSCEKDLLITNKNNKKNAKGMQNFAKIVLCGLGIEQNHAKIVKKGDKYYIQALSDTASEYTLVNGKPVYEKKQLQHNDRIILGINSVFIFKNNNKKQTDQQTKIDYEFAINQRQNQMENLSLIPPSSLNLFLPTNLLRDNKIKEIYGNPPTQALNATKRLFATQQTQSDVLHKIEEIESEFDRLVKENELKLKQKQQFYKSKLHQLKKEKDLNKEEMSSLEDKLMAKSIETETLKNKNAELEKLKKKLSKYYDEKSRRTKARESMLLETDDNRIEEDIIGEFVDLQDPNEKHKRQSRRQEEISIEQIVGTYKRKQKKVINREAAVYQDLVVEEYEDNDDLLRGSIDPRQSTDELLLADDNEALAIDKKIKAQQKQQEIKKQIAKNNYELIKMEDLAKRMLRFDFRRLYNIKILCEVQQQIICESCLQKMPEYPSNHRTNQSLTNTPVQCDAQLQQFSFKDPNNKKGKAKIKEQQLAELQKELKQLQSKLMVKQARLSLCSQPNEDDMLLNYSMEKPLATKSGLNPRESIADRRSSFSIRRFSTDSEFQLNLTQEPKRAELQRVVSQFIQILADLPELTIVPTSSLAIQPFKKPIKEFNISNELRLQFQPQSRNNNFSVCVMEQLKFSYQPVQQPGLERKSSKDEGLLLQRSQQEVIRPIQTETQEIGINTEECIILQDWSTKIKQVEFTAIINEQTQNSHQNNTQLLNSSDSREKTYKQIVEFGVNTEDESLKYQQQAKLGTSTLMLEKVEFGTSTQQKHYNQFAAMTELNMWTYPQLIKQPGVEENDDEIEDYLLSRAEPNIQKNQSQVEQYLSRQKAASPKQEKPQQSKNTCHFGINTVTSSSQSIGSNTRRNNLGRCTAIDVKIQAPENAEAEDEIQQYVKDKQEQQQLQQYLEKQLQQTEELPTEIVQNNQKLSIIAHQIDIQIFQEGKISYHAEKQQEASQIQPESQNLYKQKRLQIQSSSISVCIPPLERQDPSQVQEEEQPCQAEHLTRDRPEMIDAQVQISESQHQKVSSNDSIEEGRRQQTSGDEKQLRKRNRVNTMDINLKEMGNSNQLANLSMSEIQKHELSYQDVSVFGFDGLLREDDLNNKIKQLEDKIKELEAQSQVSPKKDSQQQEDTKEAELRLLKQDRVIESAEKQAKYQEEAKAKKQVPPQMKKSGKKKKKNQMTEEEKKEYQIQKELEAKIIQCNNQNIMNERNLQIHKRKREAEQLRKILIKKEKVQLQKQLLVLIPMVRRFNLIARQMKRLIEAKISIEYRNFSHYEMVEILKSYTVNKKSKGDNIQIKIMIMNLEEGRVYTWPSEVFQNRFQIAQQIFQQYIQNEDDEIGRNRMLQDRSEKSKDPFWDPVDFINQGNGYLSLQFLLYNISYQGYISIVYKSTIVAKLFVSLTPIKVKKCLDDEQQQMEYSESSDLQSIQIGNQRNLLDKDLYFTISIESIKFMKGDERHKMDQSTHNVNLNSVNSNILKYSISYQLLENDYKLVSFTTPEVEFIQDKQFKRIDYMRRHSFKGITESTLAYLSDCPIKFTLNVMKDYNEECLNASFNQQSSDTEITPSELNSSMYSDNKSVHSKKDSINVQDLPKGMQPKTDFSKKPSASVIYENTEMITKLQSDAKKQQEKIDKAKKMQQAKRQIARYEKERGKDKDKDKDCKIY